jgi:hypothetical protein
MNTHCYVLLQFSCGHIKDSSFRMCVSKCPTKSLSFAGLWFLTVWTKKNCVCWHSVFCWTRVFLKCGLWNLPELWSFMCLMGMVHFCVLCMQLVIYYSADFVHIWYNGWVWSEHVHIIPIFAVLLLKENMGKWWFSSFRMCSPKCPTKSLSFAGLWFLTVWTKKNCVCWHSVFC